MHWYWLALGVLATWRVTHLLQAEAGPADLLARGRRRLRGVAAGLVGCFYCLSLWVAVGPALAFGTGWRERIGLWLSCSAGAIAMEQWLRRGAAPAPTIIEDEES